jgi:hypothetical protein
MRIKNLLWIKGYLATLTAADETQLAGAQAPGAGWIGVMLKTKECGNG